MTILLRDFSSESGQYELDLSTGEVIFRRFENLVEAQSGARGFGSMKEVGLLSCKKEFFALYTLGQQLLLYADKKVFDLGNDENQLVRSGRVPFTRCFRISSGSHVHNAWWYWYTDLIEDGFNTRDFFLYVAQQSCKERERATFICFWEGVSQGRNPADPAFQNELEGLSRPPVQ